MTLAECNGLDNSLNLGFTDPDLLDVANSVPPLIGQSFTVSSINDVCILEFDFVAVGDSISFNYAFGSNEYLTYVNTTYNDIFAFFLSGPGISGPYASPAAFPDGAINIAQVPGSNPPLPITVSSVNNVTNTEYYIDNPTQEGLLHQRIHLQLQSGGVRAMRRNLPHQTCHRGWKRQCTGIDCGP